jgi:hypothetical protein
MNGVTVFSINEQELLKNKYNLTEGGHCMVITAE